MNRFRDWLIKLCIVVPLSIFLSGASWVSWQWKIDYMRHAQEDLELRKKERERLRRQNLTTSERAREWVVDKIKVKTKGGAE